VDVSVVPAVIARRREEVSNTQTEAPARGVRCCRTPIGASPRPTASGQFVTQPVSDIAVSVLTLAVTPLCLDLVKPGYECFDRVKAFTLALGWTERVANEHDADRKPCRTRANPDIPVFARVKRASCVLRGGAVVLHSCRMWIKARGLHVLRPRTFL
jgi:hypothetical protein